MSTSYRGIEPLDDEHVEAVSLPSEIDALLPSVYEELRRLAYRFLPGRADHTLQPTALVHEVYLRLFDSEGGWAGRTHFFAVAATAMRQVLRDYARRRLALKRGGGAERVALTDVIAGSSDRPLTVDLLAMHEALERLAELSPRQARLVELRFLGGMRLEDAAMVMELSRETAKRDWRMARAWLLDALADTSPDDRS